MAARTREPAVDAVRAAVAGYIIEEFLPGERPETLTDSTPLIAGGILDSLGVLKLVTFLEEHYAIAIRADETDMEKMNTVADITSLIRSKLASRTTT